MKNLYHKIYGQGDPIIILHGLFGMSDNWSTFAKQLAAEYMVITIDIRNHGRSPHVDSFTYPEAAADIAEWCEENWIYHATVLGHSMGGKVAMQLAHDHPELVEKLIVVDIAPIAYPGGHELIIETMSQAKVSSATSRKEIEQEMSQKLNDMGVVRFLMKNITRNKDGEYQWKMNLPILSKHYQDILLQPDLGHMDIPTLFVRGQNSDYITKDGEEVISNIFDNYEIETIPDAGHWVHADQPDKLLTAVKQFIH